MTNQVYLLDVCRIVIVDQLRWKIVVSCLSWVEFEANYAEAFALDQAICWVSIESIGGVLQDFVVNRSITSVGDLKCLIDWFIWAATWEGQIFVWVKLDHWYEWLRAWRERVADHSDVESLRWIDFLILSILPDWWFFHGAKKSFGLCHGFWSCFCGFLFHLSYNSLILAESSIIDLNMTLCHLEKVLIRFKWSKLSIELERWISLNCLLIWSHLEWILDPLACCSIHNI